MKMKPEHFEYLKENIIKALWNNPDMRETNKKLGGTHMRYQWDILYAAGISTWISENLYPYLDDSHIQTALNRLIKEDI